MGQCPKVAFPKKHPIVALHVLVTSGIPDVLKWHSCSLPFQAVRQDLEAVKPVYFQIWLNLEFAVPVNLLEIFREHCS